ncbi:MAG: xylulokinase [Fervidobacterium pennivorans]|uniref:Xylulose kinase n=3 Tax=Fervidobacterium pennivorans TaxID=93466 RepID=A0A7V4CP33_FERPE|nr:xylulokinase [Fervidobacterium sp.]NPU88385.1 xylulokinase [Fervidobacterium sp.]
MENICVVGLDIGTTSIKGILVDEAGKVLERAEYPIKLVAPNPGWAEENPEDWWNGTLIVLKKLSTFAKEQNLKIRAISTSGQMHSLVAIDKDGNPLHNSILWCDQRTSAECDEITQKIGGRKTALEITGNPILTGFTAGKILWLLKHEPEIFHKTYKFLLPKDFINFKMTNEIVTEHSDASGTAMYDVRTRSWSNTILGILNIDDSKLPKIVNSNSIVGTISHKIASELNLENNTIVVAGGADNACAALGIGVTVPDTAMISVGTSGTVLVPTFKNEPDEDGKVHLFSHVVNNVNYYMGVMLSATNSVEWFNKIVNFNEYDIINAEVDKIPIGARGLFFLPYLNGERTPHNDPNARGVIFGLSSAHNRFDIYRAIFEGVGYGLKDCFVSLKSSGIREIRITGGGSKSKVWVKMIADILGNRIVKVSSTEGAAYGAAILAFSALTGIEPSGISNKWISVVESFVPDEENSKKYEKNYVIFGQLYNLLKELFGRIDKG